MGYRKNRKRSNGRRSKLHTVKQRRLRTSKKHSCLSSCVHNRCCLGSEALRKMQMMKALDFGIQSGYLVPTDKTYRILHVSSDLLRKQKRRKSGSSLTRNYRRIGYDEDSWNLRDREKNDVGRKNRMNPKFEEYPVQDAKRRRSRSKRRSSRRRSRSRSKNKRRRSSRKRSRSRRSSNNSEKMGDDEDDYEQEENITKKNSRNEHTTDNNNDSRNSRSKSPDVDKTNIEKSPDDISDVSLDDDDDSEDEDDKKKSNDS